MKPVELVAVCVRFFAVSLVLSRSQFHISNGGNNSRPLAFFDSSITSPSLPLRRRDPIIVVDSGALVLGVSNSHREVHRSRCVVLSLLGVWVLIEALPQVGQQLAVWFTA